MYWTEFLTVALIHLLAVASPGPDFAVVVRESVTHGRRAGTWTALGVGCAIFLHVGYSLLGIGLIVSQSIVLFNALKWPRRRICCTSASRLCKPNRRCPARMN